MEIQIQSSLCSILTTQWHNCQVQVHLRKAGTHITIQVIAEAVPELPDKTPGWKNISWVVSRHDEGFNKLSKLSRWSLFQKQLILFSLTGVLPWDRHRKAWASHIPNVWYKRGRFLRYSDTNPSTTQKIVFESIAWKYYFYQKVLLKPSQISNQYNLNTG